MKRAEAPLRALLETHCRRTHPPDVFLRHELGIAAAGARIDLAAIDTILHGYEIKSDHDTLARLPGQAAAYGRVFDRLTLLSGPKHLPAAEDLLPDHWGLLLDQDGALTQIRPASPNNGTSPYSIAQLLWRDEALAELARIGAQRGVTRAARHYVWLRLAQTRTREQLRDLAVQTLRNRTAWPKGPANQPTRPGHGNEGDSP